VRTSFSLFIFKCKANSCTL